MKTFLHIIFLQQQQQMENQSIPQEYWFELNCERTTRNEIERTRLVEREIKIHEFLKTDFETVKVVYCSLTGYGLQSYITILETLYTQLMKENIQRYTTLKIFDGMKENMSGWHDPKHNIFIQLATPKEILRELINICDIFHIEFVIVVVLNDNKTTKSLRV